MDPITTLEKQIEMYRRMVEEHPEDTTVLFTYAEACLRRDRRLEALKAFQKLLESEPLPEARLCIAEIYLRQKLFSEAYKELAQLFELDPYHLEGHLLLWRLKAHEPVPASLEEHLSYVPGRRQLQKAFTRLRLEKSQLEGEVEQYRRVAESGGSEPIHQYYLEQARRRLSRVVEQLRLLEAWQQEAQEEAVLAGRPRPQLVPPQVPEAAAPRVEAEPEAAPPEEPTVAPAEGPEEPAQAVEGPAAGGAVPAARLEFYAALPAALAPIFERLGKTRGVAGVFLTSRDPHVVHQEVRDDLPVARVAQEVARGLEILEAFAPDLDYWVLECQGGIVVVQRVDRRHALVVVGQSGANFGALRYTIDKSKAELIGLMAGAPLD